MGIFTEAYNAETRRRSVRGMDRTDEGKDPFDPSRNPYSAGLDPDDVEWDDEQPSDEDLDEMERTIKAAQRELEDKYDSRRGARQQAEDEDESEDAADPEAEWQAQGESRRLKCTRCGESSPVTPPKGYRIRRTGEDEAAGAKKTAKWSCKKCGRINRVSVSPNGKVNVQHEAVSVFRRKYRAEPMTPDAHLGPIATFRESYGLNNDMAHWKHCLRQHGG
jgi:RNase P subunit RPR2